MRLFGVDPREERVERVGAGRTAGPRIRDIYRRNLGTLSPSTIYMALHIFKYITIMQRKKRISEIFRDVGILPGDLPPICATVLCHLCIVHLTFSGALGLQNDTGPV
jgi:hypothetical protein